MSKSLGLVLGTSILLTAILAGCGTRAVPAQPLVAGSTMLSRKDAATLVYIPAGVFKMGAENHTDEEPVHVVNLKAFWIDQTEVTNAMYERCAKAAGKCQMPARINSYTRKQYYGNPDYGNYPVIYVTWEDASAYCKWAGRRLPTEAEWERAARDTDERIYPWGNNAASKGLLNFYYYVGDTSETRSFGTGASPYGVEDLAGNVWEWVADWYDARYYSNSPQSNPRGPASGIDRVVRGGSWLDHEFFVRSALRIYYKPDSAFFNLGFRCAQDAN